MFTNVTWLVTNKCGNKCKYCKFVGRRKEAIADDKGKALSVLSNWPGASERFIVLLGGDILWMDSLVPFVVDMNYRNLPYGFQTSATDYDKMLEVLPFLRNLSISVDGVVSDPDRVKKMMYGIFWAGRALDKGIDVHATITVDPTNLLQVPGIVQILSSCGIWSEITFVHWKKSTFDLVPDRKAALQGLFYPEKDLKSVSKKLLLMKENGVLVHSSKKFLESWHHVHELDWECTEPVSCVIDTDLSMRLCLHLPGRKVRKWSIFDLAEPSSWSRFLKDWNSDATEFCMGCFWDCQFENSMADPREWFFHKG